MKVCMRFLLACSILLGVSASRSQNEAAAGAGEDETRYSLGFSGTLVFVNPKDLNESFHMVNTTLDLAIPRVNTVLAAGAQVRMSMNAQTFIVLRGEFIRIYRQFEYDAKEVSPADSQTGAFHVRNERSYHTFPIGLGVGVYLNRQRTVELEIGAMFAFSLIDEKGTLGSFGSYESTYDGRGWGVWATLRPKIAVTEWLSFAPEISGRFLSVDQFRDQRDRTLRDFSLDFRGVSIGGTLILQLGTQESR